MRRGGLVFPFIVLHQCIFEHTLKIFNRDKYHKYVNYDHPGESSPEKDCLR